MSLAVAWAAFEHAIGEFLRKAPGGTTVSVHQEREGARTFSNGAASEPSEVGALARRKALSRLSEATWSLLRAPFARRGHHCAACGGLTALGPSIDREESLYWPPACLECVVNLEWHPVPLRELEGPPPFVGRPDA